MTNLQVVLMELNNDIWNHFIFLEIGCTIPQPPVNGFIIRKFSNALLEFRCYQNFILQGYSGSFCNGFTWNTTTLPTCVPAYTAIQRPPASPDVIIGGTRCKNAPLVENSMVEYHRLRDRRGVLYWSAKYTCQSGHQLRGESQLYCSEGKWVGERPACFFNTGMF